MGKERQFRVIFPPVAEEAARPQRFKTGLFRYLIKSRPLNVLTAHFREVAARIEQYWCPIKHARRIKAAHSRYPRFFEFGDAESYLKGLERIRKEFKQDDNAA